MGKEEIPGDGGRMGGFMVAQHEQLQHGRSNAHITLSKSRLDYSAGKPATWFKHVTQG